MVRGGNSLPTIGEGYFTSFGAKDLFKKAELVKGIWISNNSINANTNAYCWVMPCNASTTYIITREKNTTRGAVGGSIDYPISGGTLNGGSVAMSGNTVTYKTGDNAKYLIIYFTVNNINIDKLIKWTIKKK